jgi:polyketide synthase PksM
MLTVLNNYAHGYVVIPVIAACKEHGLFTMLHSDQPIAFDNMVTELRANSGHLRAALQMLESLNWVSRNSRDEYRLTPESAIYQKIPDDIKELMVFPFDEYLSQNPKKAGLGRWIGLSARRWDLDNSMMAGFLDGLLVIPLLLTLKRKNLVSDLDNRKELFAECNDETRAEIISFFINQGWLVGEEEGICFTESGRYLMERIFITAAAASYKPMLDRISEVIFGDCQSVFARNLSEVEMHVDRTLNVIGSGFQHEKYFLDMEGAVIDIFSRKPVDGQPKYIADMGCGDGTLLKKVYEIIKRQTLRGQVLDQYPVRLIGIDFNEKALKETASTLRGIEHLVLKGDIGDPERMIRDLEDHGIPDVENILHIRSFLDHNRPYIPPADPAAAGLRAPIPSEAVCVDQTGNTIAPPLVIQSLVEHFQRWAQIIGRHGLLMLEVHCLETKTVGKWIDKCENLHFDAYHRFTQQLLVEAEQFLMAAAEAGLFPEPDFFRKYPKLLPYARITLNYFERRDYRVRYAREQDLPALEELENKCWPADLRTSAGALKERILQYPQGQLIIEVDHRVAGVVYSQRIADVNDIKSISMETAGQIHRQDGEIVQLLSLNILPEMQHRNLGDQLLEFMLQRCSLISGVHTVIGVTRCKDYPKHAHVALTEYIGLRNGQGKLVDTVLRLHELHGAAIQELVPDYRPHDTYNQGCGVLIKYDVHNRQRQASGPLQRRDATVTVRNTAKDISAFVIKVIKYLLGKAEAEGFDLDRPLMEMGLDSADLLELNDQISNEYQISLEPAFFFEYNTAKRIISYLLKQRNPEKAESPAVNTDAGLAEPEAPQHCRTGTLFAPGRTPRARDVAIIGAACMLPGGVNTKEQLWELLINGRAAVGKQPANRWNWPANIDPEREHRGIDMGGFVDKIDQFDAGFFRISPKEAELMDPQQRILLELSWKCLEDAGIAAHNLNGGTTGVFIGASGSDYSSLLNRDPQRIEAHYGIGASMAALANRISYFYNFSGPSMQIDTACSSSLVAVAAAVKSLHEGRCDLVLAGGINIICRPYNSIAYYKLGMLSQDGKCKTFDKAANGYVRGEGAVMLCLKPLEAALNDCDPVIAVIKGTAVNHGGQAGGFTVPNPAKQTDLFIEAYQTAEVSPGSIGYIEAHGTGTALGDPIEISGIKKAFSELKAEMPAQSCGLGSIKTNIGHLEAAAGIAGLLKVALSLKNKMIPATLNFHELNPGITLDKTPFYIVTEPTSWRLPEGQYPRRAGVSSFGSGGTNAHVVLEESPVNPGPVSKPLPYYLIGLAAKTENALRAKISDLALWLDNAGRDAELAAICATLLLGREHFKVRASLVVSSAEELKCKLRAVLEAGQAEGYFKANTGGGDDGQYAFPETAQRIFRELRSGTELTADAYQHMLTTVAQMYVKGYDIDFTALFDGEKVARISLPAYPFERERYWVPETDPYSRTAGGGEMTPLNWLHPLVQQNTSNFFEQRFSSTFTGEEFFLADHVVKQQRILPGVAHLEMARAAAVQAAKVLEEGPAVTQITDVVWVRPIVAEGRPVQVHIGLFPEDNGEIGYQISGAAENDAAEPVLYSQGSVMFAPAAEIPGLDLRNLQEQCGQAVILAGRCYESYRSIGMDYGPGFQGIETVFTGPGQALAKLNLPASVGHTRDQFLIHPSLMDPALHAAIGLEIDPSRPDEPPALRLKLGYALREMKIFSQCPATVWAYIRYSEFGGGSQTKELDIDICDDQGLVCAQVRGFLSRVLEEGTPAGRGAKEVTAEIPRQAVTGNSLLVPVWDPVAPEPCPNFPAATEAIVIAGGTAEQWSAIRRHYPGAAVLESGSAAAIEALVKELEAYQSIGHIIWLTPHQTVESLTDERLIAEQRQGALHCFRMIKALLRLGYGTKELGWSVLTARTQPIRTHDAVNPTHMSLHGLIGSMAKEYPNWKVRLLDLEAECDPPWAAIFTLPPDPQGNAWVYRSDEWYRQKLIPLELPEQKRTLYKQSGVYVVIGGAGGIGEIWSEYMIRTYQARIVWVGRRRPDETIRAKMERLAALGPAPHYIAADASDRKALQRAYAEIKQDYGRINGVIHSAVGLLDRSLANMEEADFKAGLSSKIDVSVRIAQVFHEEPLDFILFFSSVVTFLKDYGKSSYVAGCAFEDVFARRLAGEAACAVKTINWGYWGEVGIGSMVPNAFKNRLAQSGVGRIEPGEAMQTLETLLAGPVNQVALLKTTGSLTLEGVDSDETITEYAGGIPFDLQTVRVRSLEKVGALRKAAPEGSLPLNEMEAHLYKLLWCQLGLAGLIKEDNTTVAAFKSTVGMPESYSRWLEESLTVLAANNYLHYDPTSGKVSVTFRTDTRAAWEEWEAQKDIWLRNPDMKARVNLADAALRALPEILTGKQRATDIMFPDSSMELVEGVYKDNLVADYYNEALADTVGVYLEERMQRDPSARVRILEIGAGTGGTSVKVFAELHNYRAHIEEYCYSDVSRAFLLHAESEYGRDNPYLSYKIFNVEHPVAGQAIAAGGYDIVIATNVLHATRNIRRTLRNAKAALAKDGLIILNEISKKSLFYHVTFGLLDGWWLYEDPKLRISGCPALGYEIWRRVLESEGFRGIFSPLGKADEAGQRIIAAVSDGVVRQKRPVQPETTPSLHKTAPSPAPRQVRKQSDFPLSNGSVAMSLLREKSIAYFKRLVGGVLKIPYSRIDAAEPLEEYGIDSILVVQLNNALRKVFANITSTLFFEYQTIEGLTEHFIRTQKDALIALLNLNEPASGAAPPGMADSGAVTPVYSRPLLRKNERLGPFRPVALDTSQNQAGNEPIAIIGLSGRYPQARTMQAYWENLKAGKDCISEIPPERWPLEGFFEPDPVKAVAQGMSYCKSGGFIEGFAEFDPLFFNIAPREALNMDPQERLFVESCWEVLEDAGYTREQLAAQYHGRVGVFAGITRTGFDLYGPVLWQAGKTDFPHTSFSSVANRVSYLLNLKGPSMPVDTMCSSSLTAIHEACEHLYRDECDMAMAGGVNVYLHPSSFIYLSGLKMLSADGRCKSFGKGANGFVSGEGVGVVLLKRLSRAIEDQDHIYAVIRGTGINHGGKTNGYTVPNPVAQGELIRAALDKAGINSRTVSYVEAHGTGTDLGDPIEIAGLTRAFQTDTSDTQFCAIGSVKTNIGHLEAAAGIASLTKVVLQMEHRQLAPSLHAQELNPNIDFNATPFVVQRELTEWKRPVVTIDGVAKEYPRIAAVSSFGAGGANAHVLIEEYPPVSGEPPSNQSTPGKPQIIVLSAKSPERLRVYAQRLVKAVREGNFADADLAAIAYTLQVGREAMEERLGVIVRSVRELEEKLSQFIEGREEIEAFYRGQVQSGKATLAVLQADEDIQATIEQWIHRGKHDKLVELWVRGLGFDWRKIYDGAKPRRLSLPTYPFAAERYWSPDSIGGPVIDPLLPKNRSNLAELRSVPAFTGTEFFRADSTQTSPASLPSRQTEEPCELMTFEEFWQEQSPPDVAADKAKVLVCLLSDPENQQTVVDALPVAARVVFIARGTACQKISPQSYRIPGAGREHYEEALRSIREDYGEVDALLYMWAFEDSGYIENYAAIVHLLQALAASKLKARRLILAAPYANVLERCYLESWIGFERSLGLVLPDTEIVTVIQEAGGNEREKALNAGLPNILTELPPAKSRSVLYREGKRYECRIRPAALTSGASVSSVFRKGGTYLITGGCGGLGFIFAEHIAKTQPVQLILCGRSGMDERKQSQIKLLQDLGSRVRYIQADVADEAGMREGLSIARQQFGKIHGVIHAAGLQGGPGILEKDFQSFAGIIGPKIQGTLVLDRLLREEEPDFICYFSSAAAILGDFGSCDYAVGNRFQMAYAQHYRLLSGPGKAVAINWPLWKEGGMGFATAENGEMYLKSSGQRFLETEEGRALFDRALAQTGAQYLVIAGQPSRVRRFLGLEAAPSAPSHPEPDSRLTPGRRVEMKGLSPAQCLEWELKEQISRILQISRERLDLEKNLADFGFDSISLAEFATALSGHFEIEITPALFYGYSTIKSLIGYFLSEHRETVREFYRDNAPAPPAFETVPPVSTPLRRRMSGPELERSNAASGIPEPIAIIGMSGRFPGARNIDELWRTLAEGRDMIREIPPERFDWRPYYGDPARESGKTNCKWCGCIPGVAEFDPLFFEISPREAAGMDPRQRLLLQESWNALEDAGYGPKQIKANKIGMFVGIEEGDYQLLSPQKGAITSNHNAISASRLAYFLDLNGPVMALNTTCSSGLVAAHQACLSLRNHECDTAIAAGASLLLTPESLVMMGQAGMLSSDGKCFVFDQRANGMVPGEAVAAVVLKRLTRARADGDPIYAVIRGSSINYDGKTNGITAPNGRAQSNLLKAVYERYQVNPEEIEYIVTHGTGTKLGDPVEVNALYDAFKCYTAKKNYCALTSTKANLGHAFAASGIVSLISLVQALRHETIPASLHCEEESAYIHWQESPFYVNKTAKPWSDRDGNRRTGAVSAFGMSGTNVHMVLNSYPVEDAAMVAERPPYFPLAFSAKTQAALEAKIKDLIGVLQNPDLQERDLSRISYTLLEGRHHFNYRCAVIAQGPADAVHLLKQAGKAERLPNLFQGNVPRDFGGQKVMYEYAADLLNKMPSFRNEAEKYREALSALADLYCQGYELPWEQLYGEARPDRVHLPTYPFAKECYWAPQAAIEAQSLPQHPLPQPNSPGPAERAPVPTTTLPPLIPLRSDCSGIPVKPSGVSLQLLSTLTVPPIKTAEPTGPSIVLPATGLPGPPRDNFDGLQAESGVTPAVTAETLREELLTSLAEALYIGTDEVDPDQPFIDLGLDSIIGVEWIRTLNQRYGTAIAATKVYDYPSIREFAGFLERELPKSRTGRGVKTDLTIKAAELARQPGAVTPTDFSGGQGGDTAAKEGESEGAAAVTAETLREELLTSLAEALYIGTDEVDPDQPFIDLGLDSIIGVEWIRTLNQRYGTAIAATKVYDYPSIREFAGFLERELPKSGAGGAVNRTRCTPPDAVGPRTAEPEPRDNPPEMGIITPPSAREEQPLWWSGEREAIAVIGMSGRYPDAGNLEEYWNNLVQARNSIKEIPRERWDAGRYYDPQMQRRGKIYCKWLGALDDIEYFDPLFFNISPTEAELIDPQHRLFLQEGYRAFEDAGYSRKALNNRRCGVYLGIMSNEYGMLLYKNEIGAVNTTGSSNAIGAARLPYFLNLKGPAIPIDTACSSSLVAVHLACQALLNREIDMGLVGGVSLYLTPEPYIGMCAAGMLSPEGQCKTFDDGADGFVPGEGVGALLLKRLNDAEADHDPIYGVIIGSGINQDGKTNGITAPSVNSQIELEREIYARNAIDPAGIGYVEMHGTGTKLGDPIELEALSTVFKARTDRRNYCAIGAVKSNIGHTSAASGIAGVQKVLLCMKHQTLVPTLNFKKHNAHFDFEDSPFYVNTQLQPWEGDPEKPRRAGVSSFGFSGTNAHIVIEEYRPRSGAGAKPAVRDTANSLLFVLSAQTEPQLKSYAERIKRFIEAHEDLNLTDLAYTLQIGREALDYRLAFAADSRADLLNKLTEFAADHSPAGVIVNRAKQHQAEIAVFETDEDAKTLIRTWMQKRKTEQVLELWVKGLNPDWEQLYPDRKPRRISLPTYPFARERYWAPLSGNDEASLPVAAAESPPRPERVILRKEWIPLPLPEENRIPGGFIVVLGTHATAELVLSLFAASEEVHILPVVHGEGRSDAPAWRTTDFYDGAAGEILYEQVKAEQRSRKFLGVIDITAYDAEYEQSLEVETGKIVFLQKLAGQAPNDGGCVLIQVTHRLNDFGTAQTTLQGARLAGLYRMLSAEYPQIAAMTMDCDCPIRDSQILARQIETEFASGLQKDLTECCYRDGARYIPRLTVCQTGPDCQNTLRSGWEFHENDVILITGGSRGIGASLAGHLISRGVKRLVIMGREALPQPDHYREHRGESDQPGVNAKRKLIQSWIDRGVQVRYYNTPLTDREGLNAMVREIRDHLGPITGVFHCAGLTSGNPAFIKKLPADIEAVCAPKIKGLAIMEQALEKEPLSFFVLFSSIAAAAPALAAGYSDYAMANAYMDYFATYQAGNGKTYFKSIQWPAWGETGMAAGKPQSPVYRKIGLAAHSTADGLKWLELLMQLAYTVNLPWMMIPGEAMYDLLKKEIVPAGQPGGLEASIVAWLQGVLAAELKLAIERLDEDKPFDEYGVDSISLAQITQILEKKAGQRLAPSLFIEYNTISALKNYFLANHRETLTRNLGVALNRPRDNSSRTGGGPPAVQERRASGPAAPLREEIAVVGISCRFPGSPTRDSFWNLLTRGGCAIQPQTEQRRRQAGRSGDWGGWLEDIDLFDPGFFNIDPGDAAVMDPQARLIMEESLGAIYDAGYDHRQLAGQNVGVYIGGRAQAGINLPAVLRAPNPILGMGQNYLAANISRFFNFNGPSLVVDTACSSAITGLLFAADSLRERRIDAALVGAVNILLTPWAHELFAARNILSRTGRFHIFDRRASGEVLGEGAGVVMIKRLSDAIKDGNRIYGIVKAIAVNNDGRTLGPGSPNLSAQKQVMREALKLSGKNPEDIGYIEVNGGGSPVVDAVEIKALSDVYALNQNAFQPCFLGSVKPNIGHLLLSSGLAGFIRCVLSVYHQEIPPSLAALEPFEYYDFAAARICFNRETVRWETAPGKRRIAAQNSFPDGGTNCHVIIEEFGPDPSYRQRYFPRDLPAMDKKCFPLAEAAIEPVPAVRERSGGSPDWAEKMAKRADQKPGQQDSLMIKNVWGEIRW